jgi:type IV secretory pathway VirB9-like protein
VAGLGSTGLLAQSVLRSATVPSTSRGLRTIPYHARDLVTLRAKVRYTTMIVLPAGEDILEVTCGDKEFWIVNAHGAVAYVKPAKPGSETNLNLLTASGEVYAFVLSEISAVKGAEPDLAVYLEPDDPASFAPWHQPPKYVPAQQVEDFRAQAEIAREDARRETAAAQTRLEDGLTAFRATYPLRLQFPYRVALGTSPFFVRAMFHDDHVTYIQAHAPELPSLYELKDGRPNLVNFDVHDGTYIVPKVLDSGYLTIGKKRLVFTRVVDTDAR